MDDYTVSPSMWRDRPFSFALTVVLSIGIVGLAILIPWWLIYRNRQLTITESAVRYEEGVFTKHISEMRLRDVRNVQVEQGLIHRLTEAGNVQIASAGSAEAEIAVQGIPNPKGIRRQIDFRQTKQATRETSD